MSNQFIDNGSYDTLIDVANSLNVSLNFDLNVLNNVISFANNELKQNSLISKFLHLIRFNVNEIDELKGKDIKELINDITNYNTEINVLHNELIKHIETIKATETKQLNDYLLLSLQNIQNQYKSNYSMIDYTIKIELNKSIFTYKIIGTKETSEPTKKDVFSFDINKLPCKIEEVKFFKYTYKDTTIKFTINEGVATNIDTLETYKSKVELYKAANHIDGIGINFYRDVTIINQNMIELKFKQ